MNKNKKIQINLSIFVDIYLLLDELKYYELDSKTLEYCKNIERHLNEKLEAIERRDLYTRSKTAPSEPEREEARQKYLDIVGIHKDFRY